MVPEKFTRRKYDPKMLYLVEFTIIRHLTNREW